MGDQGRAPCSEQHLLQMPVFLNRRLAALSSKDLHESYRPGASVYELTLNKRARKVIEALGIKTIGELLVTPRRMLTSQWGFGPTTLDVLHRELKQFLLDEQPGRREQAADFSSFKALAGSLIRMTTAKPRDVDVLEKRLGISEEGHWSLGKLGSRYGLTRERIRQVEETALREMSMRARRKTFDGFWRDVFEIVEGAGGKCALGRLAGELARRYNWPDVSNTSGFAKLMGLRPELRVDKKAGAVSRW